MLSGLFIYITARKIAVLLAILYTKKCLFMNLCFSLSSLYMKKKITKLKKKSKTINYYVTKKLFIFLINKKKFKLSQYTISNHPLPTTFILQRLSQTNKISN